MRKRLKKLISEKTVVLPGAFNGFAARVIEEIGYSALYISGAGLANGLGALPDVGLLTMTEVFTQVSYITGAVNIPCIVDCDTGFGETVNTVRMIKWMEKTGVSAVHIEDQVLPKKCGHLMGKSLVSVKEMKEKITAAVEARNDPDFMIIARTDARGVEGFKKSIKRAQAYLDAGADAIFPEALETKEEFARFSHEVPTTLMANMTEFGKSPYLNVSEFEQMGYKMVIFPLTAFRVMAKSVIDSLRILKQEGTQKNFLNDMLHRQDIYSILGYKEYERIDKKVWDTLQKKEE